jgi:hypothetical protein
MDGPFWVDSRTPFINADIPAVTLLTTDLALVPPANLPALGANYFAYVGKCVRIRLFGRIITGVTPGNGTVDIYWGNGAAANGTVIGASAAFALTASMPSTSWRIEAYVRCRAMGATGSLLVTGFIELLNSATLTAAGTVFLIPASAPAAVTVDLTQNFVISPQFKRSGSTAESMQVHDVSFEALN